MKAWSYGPRTPSAKWSPSFHGRCLEQWNRLTQRFSKKGRRVEKVQIRCSCFDDPLGNFVTLRNVSIIGMYCAITSLVMYCNTHTRHDITWGCLFDHKCVVFFFWSNLCCSQSRNTTYREILPNFVYKLNMKIFFGKHFSIFWATWFNYI